MPTDTFNLLDDSNDPPIIITGGGGASLTAAQNTVHIEYDEDVTPPRPRKKIKAKNNADPLIKGVTIDVEGTDGLTVRTATLAFPFEMQDYKVKVTFVTKKSTASTKPTRKGGSKAKAARNGKKR
jgi:hypothetical protein